MSVKPIPDGFHTVTPYLAVKDAAGCIEFLKKGLGAEVIQVSAMEDGTVMNSEIRIGSSMVMVAEARPDYLRPANLYLYVEDCDAWYKRAVEAGAESVMEPTDQFYGDRSAGFKDAHGNEWWVATRKENLTSEEIRKRAKEIPANS